MSLHFESIVKLAGISKEATAGLYKIAAFSADENGSLNPGIDKHIEVLVKQASAAFLDGFVDLQKYASFIREIHNLPQDATLYKLAINTEWLKQMFKYVGGKAVGAAKGAAQAGWQGTKRLAGAGASGLKQGIVSGAGGLKRGVVAGASGLKQGIVSGAGGLKQGIVSGAGGLKRGIVAVPGGLKRGAIATKRFLGNSKNYAVVGNALWNGAKATVKGLYTVPKGIVTGTGKTIRGGYRLAQDASLGIRRFTGRNKSGIKLLNKPSIKKYLGNNSSAKAKFEKMDEALVALDKTILNYSNAGSGIYSPEVLADLLKKRKSLLRMQSRSIHDLERTMLDYGRNTGRKMTTQQVNNLLNTQVIPEQMGKIKNFGKIMGQRAKTSNKDVNTAIKTMFEGNTVPVTEVIRGRGGAATREAAERAADINHYISATGVTPGVAASEKAVAEAAAAKAKIAETAREALVGKTDDALKITDSAGNPIVKTLEGQGSTAETVASELLPGAPAAPTVGRFTGMSDKVRNFVKERPMVSGAALGAVGVGAPLAAYNLGSGNDSPNYVRQAAPMMMGAMMGSKAGDYFGMNPLMSAGAGAATGYGVSRYMS